MPRLTYVEEEGGKRIFGDKHIVAKRFDVPLSEIETTWIDKRHPDYVPHMYYSRSIKNGTGLKGVPAKLLDGYRGHGQRILFDLEEVEKVIRRNRVMVMSHEKRSESRE